jgi:tetratricopeptide (TPR) repeat protein
MKVTISHYINFWLFNSASAFATGLIIGFFALKTFGAYFFKPSIEFPAWCYLSGPWICFFLYQFMIVSFFWGKSRGEFEYSFLEKSAEHGELNKELGKLLKGVKKELKMADPNSAHIKLNEAMKIFPENFVVHFKYAVSCERLGLAEDAISAYDTARELLPQSQEAVTNYVQRQISRVKTKGPAKVSTAPGLQYVLY